MPELNIDAISESRTIIRLATIELIGCIRTHNKLFGEDMKSDALNLMHSSLTEGTY